MAQITLKGKPVHTVGNLPEIGSTRPGFTFTKTDLTDTHVSDYDGKRIILNIFPSLDTRTCAVSVRQFNAKAGNMKNTVVLCVSMDLPFAHKRFCIEEGLNDVISASVFRSPEFGENFGVTIIDGTMAGLMSRAIVIIDEHKKIIYTEQVAEISQEPDYDKAMASL